MKNFRTYQLAKALYTDCKDLKLPQPHKDQFDRASLGILLNLAEGSAKPTAKDRRKFYAIAMGSLREIQVVLDVCGFADLHQKSDSVAASLYRLQQNPGGRG